MEQYSEAYVGLDVSKLRNAVAVAESGRNGEIRYLGEIENTSEATRKLAMKLAAKYEHLHFCYEAGPTGYGNHGDTIPFGITGTQYLLNPQMMQIFASQVPVERARSSSRRGRN